MVIPHGNDLKNGIYYVLRESSAELSIQIEECIMQKKADNLCHPAGSRRSTACIVFLILLFLLPTALFAQDNPDSEAIAVEQGRSGLFFDTGFGTGIFIFDGIDGSPDATVNFTIGIDGRIGTHINSNLAIILMTHCNFTSFASLVDFTEWVFAKNDLRLLLVPFIPAALFFESQVFLGPGIIYYTNTRAPSVYVEGGIGYSQIQSLSQKTFIMGAGFFAGVGVEITDHISCGARLIWSPSFLHSSWTPSEDHYFSAMIFFYLI
jgi:hypothetical protein